MNKGRARRRRFKRVAGVDSNKERFMTLKRTIGQANRGKPLSVLHAANLVEAFAVVDSAPLEVILMNCANSANSVIRMRQLRTVSGRIPLFAMVGSLSPEHTQALLTAGADDLIHRTKISEQILPRVFHVLEGASKTEGQASSGLGRVRPMRVFSEVCEATQSAFHARQVDFVWKVGADVPQSCLGDEQKLRRVLINLLDHFLGQTRSGSFEARLKAIAGEQGKVTLQLLFSERDSVKNEEEVFQLYRPLQDDLMDSTPWKGQNGWGLFAVKEIVKAQRGGFHIYSGPDVGLEMLVEMDYPLF